MDTSEIYIKMCEKAKKIQDLRPFGKAWIQGDAFITEGKLTKFRVAARHRKDIWLPSQGQLQEMIGDRPNHPWDLAYMFGLFCHPWKRIKGQLSGFPAEYYEDGIVPDPLPEIVLNQGQLDYPKKFTSMEQLWLAFVMKEKHNKAWNGEDWVKVT